MSAEQRVPIRAGEEVAATYYRCSAIELRFATLIVGLPMTVIKSGDLVVLKSGGPIMTVDTVNTDIFDDDKVTGVLCAWFVGEKLERVRFDHRAIELARLQEGSPGKKEVALEEAAGEYKVVLDEMAAAMNLPVEAEKDASKLVSRRPKRAPAKYDMLAGSPTVSGVVS
jgi:uncharacterized protein YodC (DUF2158 family)